MKARRPPSATQGRGSVRRMSVGSALSGHSRARLQFQPPRLSILAFAHTPREAAQNQKLSLEIALTSRRATSWSPEVGSGGAGCERGYSTYGLSASHSAG